MIVFNILLYIRNHLLLLNFLYMINPFIKGRVSKAFDSIYSIYKQISLKIFIYPFLNLLLHLCWLRIIYITIVIFMSI